jgi:hypothetical protein
MTVVSPDGSRCRAFLGPEVAEALAGEELSMEMTEGELLIRVEEMAEAAEPVMMSEASAESPVECAPPPTDSPS